MTAASTESLKGKALDLGNLIAYGDQAVVSRTLIDRKTGTLTLFAFDTGQGLSEHTAPYDAAVQILEGEALITIGGDSVPARAGQLVIMPAGIPHALKAEQRFKMMLIMIRS